MTTSARHLSTRHRLLTAGAVVTFASVGLATAATPAQAADVNSKVWVCKYVRTPGGDEVLKGGKNPIEVSGSSIDKDKDGQIYVGDQFADAQERSVVVQIEGEDPGAGICSPTPPPVAPTTPTTPPTNTPTTGTTPGTIAPSTGGEGGSSLPVGLVGGGVLVVGAALLAAEAERRRRAAARP
ncbi:MAG: hypothetical protein ABJA89_00030 [Lapillicoccus sp.]